MDELMNMIMGSSTYFDTNVAIRLAIIFSIIECFKSIGLSFSKGARK